MKELNKTIKNYFKSLVIITQKSIKYLKMYGIKAFVNKLMKKLNLKNPFFVKRRNIVAKKIKLIKMEETIIPFEDANISVIIPTKNAGGSFEQLLSMIRKQKGCKNIEIVIVDSGSTDNTIEFANSYKAKIVEIPAEKFSHSYSRNLGAENASGSYLLFITQDILPPNDLWLYELLLALKNNDVVAVSCAEFPREDCDLIYRVLSWNHTRFLELDKNDRICSKPQKENYLSLRKNGQLSDVTCLIIKDIFMNYKYRYDYGEDLDLGIRLIKDNHKLALLSSINVIHSHNRSPYYYLKRWYVDSQFLNSVLPDFPIPEIEIKYLVKDIIEIYRLINCFINVKLLKTSLPCSIEDLSHDVQNIDKLVLGHNINLNLEIDSNKYIDNEFKNFLKQIYSSYSANDIFTQKNKANNEIFFNSVLNFINLTLEYMKSCYEYVDDTILEEFKDSIFKAYAIICGEYLAYCYLKDINGAKEELKNISAELIKGV